MLDPTPATFEEFEREAKRGNVVPVVRSVLADLQTPAGAFLRIAGDASDSFLLESIEGGARVARYPFLGDRPTPAGLPACGPRGWATAPIYEGGTRESCLSIESLSAELRRPPGFRVTGRSVCHRATSRMRKSIRI